MAAAKKIGLDAVIATVLTELAGVVSIKRKTKNSRKP